MIETGRVDTVSVVTHRFPLGSVVEAIETVTNREAIKVAVLWAAEPPGRAVQAGRYRRGSCLQEWPPASACGQGLEG
jgi:hypothetical protein